MKTKMIKLIKQLPTDDKVWSDLEKWKIKTTNKKLFKDCIPDTLYRRVDGWGEIDWMLKDKKVGYFIRLSARGDHDDALADELSEIRESIKNKIKRLQNPPN